MVQTFPLLWLQSATSADDVGMRIDTYEPNGGARHGPITTVLEWEYSDALSLIGAAAFTIPAESAEAEHVEDGREFRMYKGGEGLVFVGRIDQVETEVAEDGSTVLRVSGPSIAAELIDELAGGGAFALNNVPIAEAVSALIDGSAWHAGELDSPTTNFAGRMDGVSQFVGLSRVADEMGLHLRCDGLARRVNIGAFGEASGIHLQNVEAVSVLNSNQKFVTVAALRKLVTSGELVNYVIPFGKDQGIQGEKLSLENSTRTTPYAIQTGTFQDGTTYYYISDATSIAAHGTRKKMVQFKHQVPQGLTAADFEYAANAVYDEAVTYLQRHKDRQTAYSVSVLGLRHLVNGTPHWRLGETMHLRFAGIVERASGRAAWESVDEDLYVMAYRRQGSADGSDRWDLTVSTVPRMVPNDGNVTAQLIASLQTMEAAPLPFVVFGGRVARMDLSGLQLIAPPNEYAAMVSFVTDFVAAEDTQEIINTYPRAGLEAQRFGSPEGFLTRLRAALTSAQHAEVEPFAYGTVAGINLGASIGGVQTAHLVIESAGRTRVAEGIFQIPTFDVEPTHQQGDIWYQLDEDRAFIDINGEAKPLGGAGMELVVKEADETVNNSTTLQDDNHLFFAVAANEAWQFEGVLIVTNANNAADFKMAFTFSAAGAVGSFGIVALELTGGAQDAGGEALGTAVNTTGLATYPAIVRFWGAIKNGANAGNLKLQWAQQTLTAADTKVLAGAYLKYQKES